MQSLLTWHIHFSGLVQGIGFRPHIYKLACQLGLNGWVSNDSDGVHIEFNASKETAKYFYDELRSKPPPLSKIRLAKISVISKKEFRQFDIIHRNQATVSKIELTPDYASCPSCIEELHDPADRRFKYPFITCSECGPRYSIIHNLPYDRNHTKMDTFQMCSGCQTEYNAPSDKRYYAQTLSCPSCSVDLTFYNAKKEVEKLKDTTAIINTVVEKWSQGKIVAIKGIGGYLITCCASNLAAIEILRKRKRRPHKPLAMMYRNQDALHQFNLTEQELKQMHSAAAPIVLIPKSEENNIQVGICDDLSRVGIMLAYTPLYDLLLKEYGRPVVATSGNISNAPILFQDDHALNELPDIVDFILTNNREIVTPQDDSLIAFTTHFQQRIILRRSRGLAPSYFNSELSLDLPNTLSMGAYLKSTFAFQHHGNTYVSQYLGDLANYETEKNYLLTLSHLKKLLRVNPESIVVDLHPQYASTILGKQTANKLNIPLIEVQHHVAHFSAVLGEHALLNSKEKILGVIWDGTGLGTDGNIWGGEFFIYQNYRFDRHAHLAYFQQLAQDKMAKEPRLSALTMTYGLEGAEEKMKTKFTDVEWKIYSKKLNKKQSLQSSSIGRLFDAVASILGILDIQTYEGQAAALLQVEAEKHFHKQGLSFGESYCTSDNPNNFSGKKLMHNILIDLANDYDKSHIAAKFHLTLVHWISQVARKNEIKKIGFSGGVFQNTLLVDLLIYHLKNRYELLFHKALSPNDENISFGQLIYAEIVAKNAKESLN